MRPARLIIALIVTLASIAPVHSSTFVSSDGPAVLQLRWTHKPIHVALSSSLSLPGPNIKPGSDVLGAVRRALRRWSNVADIAFVEAQSKAQSISPIGAGDGISLITVASTPENSAIFGSGNDPARTRVFYDSETGEISEADIAINPNPYSAEGTPLQFSTDGTPGTYDLESTFVHEIGHFLGLDHSAVIGSTMEPCQGLNGLYGLPAFTERTLSETDRAAIRSLYGPHEDLGTISGRVLNNIGTSALTPVAGSYIWVENIATGRVTAGAYTAADGTYRIDSIPPGEYRVLNGTANLAPERSSASEHQRLFRGVEIAGHVLVKQNQVNTVNYIFVAPQNSPASINPRLLGTSTDLSTVPLPAKAGRRLTIYVGGEGVDQVPGSGISIASPYMKVDPASLTLEQFGTSFPVISFDVIVSDDIPFGDYSLRLQANSGEIAYLAGGITVDTALEAAFPLVTATNQTH